MFKRNPAAISLLAAGETPADQPLRIPAIGDHSQIRMGDLVRDRISGFVGTLTERQHHLNGCEFLCVEDTKDSTKTVIDATQRWELLEHRPELHIENEKMTGSHVKLGDEVKDTLSGFTGHIVVWSIPLFGTQRIGIDPGLVKDGELGKITFFDECRVQLVKAKAPPVVKAAKPARVKSPGACPTTMDRDGLPRREMNR